LADLESFPKFAVNYMLMRYVPILAMAFVLTACAAPRQGEMKLHYDRPAAYFEEALPIGNGRLGAMVYGGTAADKLSLNDITLWTGEPESRADHVDMELYPGLTRWGEAARYIDSIRILLF
jgi:hypothetical protein